MGEPPELTDAEIIKLGISEDSVARLFAHRWRGKLAFCHDHGKWAEYDGNTWRFCRVPVAFQYARELSRNLSNLKPTAAALKTRFAAGVEKFAQADPIFRRTADHWDRDIFLLGTPAGTVDLRTGRLRASMQSDFITKSTAVAPEEFEDCPTWFRFLNEATGGDEEMIRFLQQIAGYSLTGDISEQALFFIHGPGGAGKGTFINTLQYLMGDYAKVSAMETFAARKHAQHSTELAMLRGARLVTASETEEGAAWAEARIKQLTGGDVIAARFMRQDFFEFLPQFTLVIVGNFKPTLRTVDEAMRRRFNIIPFTIIPKRKDRNLAAKLAGEAPGILRWMINGCLDWQANGLVRPDSVVSATDEYFEDQNTTQQWLEESCDVDFSNFYRYEKTGPLFESWSRFAKLNGAEIGNSKSFKATMERMGFKYKRDKTGRYFYHVSLKKSDDDDDGR
jgi:putative DNA primase/helicase